MVLQAVLFDLHNTLVHHKEKPLTSEELSEFLVKSGYHVYPQSWDAASHYTFIVDYPRHGYRSRQSFLRQVLGRLHVTPSQDVLERLAQLQDRREKYYLFPDAVPAVKRVKKLGLKTAIVTTIPEFAFAHAIEPIGNFFNLIMTGYKARCEKSNPLMHKKVLKELDVEPSQAVMIGDNLLVDVKIPKSLGMKTILLDRTESISKKPIEADRKTKTMKEAIDVVEKWHKL